MISIRVDAACTVQLRYPQNGRQVRFKALGFGHHGQHYLTLTTADVVALMRFERNEEADAGADAVPVEENKVFLLRYRLDGDEFRAEAPNPDAFGRLVEEGLLKGRKESYSVLVQERPRRLRRWLRRDPGLFDKGDVDLGLRLRRLPATGDGP